MLFSNVSNMWMMIVLLIIKQTSAISYNRPTFCPNASWYPNPTIFLINNTIVPDSFGIFVNTNNSVYVNSQSLSKTEVWLEGDVNPTKTIATNLPNAHSIFVTDNSDIYVDNGDNGRVDKWTMNATSSVPVMNVIARCTGLFVDINNTIYCSMWDHNRVTRKSFTDAINTTTIVAGNGISGLATDMLNAPHGIFVDINFKLYVADCGNDRIQSFEWGQLNGSTVAGSGATGTISLNCPTGIVLDGDGYQFIADRGGQSIVGSGPNGFRCIVGCSGVNGATSSILSYPETLSFDSYGNIFVTGRGSNGLLKFILATNSCDHITTSQPPKTSTIDMGESTTTLQSTYLSTTVLSTIVTTTKQSTLNTDMSSKDPMVTTDETTTTMKPLPSSFVAPTCSDPTRTGIHCNVSIVPCDILKPCQNNASCINTNNSYICICSAGFNGTECQFDYRPCKPNTCWNNGTCQEVTNTTFNCTCAFGWTGIHCETKINYCDNITCLNNGVCRPLLGDYKCECLGGFSGRYCEITANQIVVRKVVSKSCAYIAILAGTSVIAFVVIMDILKYCFGIDPVRDELEQIRRKKRAKKAKRPVIIRHTYIDAPRPAEQQSSTIEGTTV